MGTAKKNINPTPSKDKTEGSGTGLGGSTVPVTENINVLEN
jgi:hypothetical protein